MEVGDNNYVGFPAQGLVSLHLYNGLLVSSHSQIVRGGSGDLFLFQTVGVHSKCVHDSFLPKDDLMSVSPARYFVPATLFPLGRMLREAARVIGPNPAGFLPTRRLSCQIPTLQMRGGGQSSKAAGNCRLPTST